MGLQETGSSSKEMAGFCHSCLMSKPLNEIAYSQKSLLFSDSWIPEKNGAANRALVEWRTMETSMEDGLLGRAAISRTSRGGRYAESSDNFFHYDSLHYGSRQDYKRRIKKSSREWRGGPLVEGSNPEFFEGMCSKCLPEDPEYPRILNDERLDSDMNSSQAEEDDQTRRLYGFDQLEEAAFHTTNPLEISTGIEISDAKGELDLTDSSKFSESSNTLLFPGENDADDVDFHRKGVECRHRSNTFPPPLSSLVRKTSSFLPHKIPSVLLQPIRNNGRFILQEVHVATQMVFQPIREDGRLLLKLFRHNNLSSENKSISSENPGKDYLQVEESCSEFCIESDIATGVEDGEKQLTHNQVSDKHHHLTAAVLPVKDRRLTAAAAAAGAQGEQASNQNLSDNIQHIAADQHISNQKANRQRPLSNLEKIGSDHLGVLQTMQQILFQTQQYHHNREFHDELVRSFAARALKLTLCRAALTNTDRKSSSIDDNTVPISIAHIREIESRANHIDHDKKHPIAPGYQEDYLQDELCPHDTFPKLFQTQHKSNIIRDGVDPQDPSLHDQCRTYKGSRRQARDPGLISATWKVRCIAT